MVAKLSVRPHKLLFMTTGANRQPSTALLTDHYELTMLRAALADGTAHRRSVFELFPRSLPTGRRYGVVGGVGRALEAIRDFRFEADQIAWLLETDVIDEPTAEYLREYRFSGDAWGYPEGEIYFPGAPLLVIESTFAEACILETLLLSIYNHDSAIMSAASRMVAMAAGRPCMEMGARRTQEEAAVACARAAYIAGFAATSDLEAGRRYGIPTSGTAAHSFTLLHDDETEAFRSQVDSLGPGTTLLVDTYSIKEGIETAVKVAGPELGAVRIDSGDLGVVVREAREQLDALGNTKTRIIVTNDLDEWQIAALRAVPVDGYGVGTALATGSGHPTCAFVYKLVARGVSAEPDAQLKPVAKKSEHKGTYGGRKYALRRLNEQGVAECDVIGVGTPPQGDHNDRELLVPLIRDGELVGTESLETARERHQRVLHELPRQALMMSRGVPALPVLLVQPDGTQIPHPYTS